MSQDPRSLSLPRAGAVEVPVRDRADGASLRLLVPLGILAAAFLSVALVRSALVGIPLRDPHGILFWGRIPRAIGLGLVAALVDLLVRSVRLWRHPVSGPGPEAAVARPSYAATLVALARARWPWRRIVLAVAAVVGYYVVYVSYRNLKSWDVLLAPHDTTMLRIDRWLTLGHSPGVLLHDLLGTDHAAVVLSAVYSSFTQLVVATVVGAIFLIGRVREAYVFVLAGCWAWILGTLSYYLIPTLGPFASAPEQFAGLRRTHVNTTWAIDLAGRQDVLHRPGDPSSFAGISAFASLHTGFTCLVLLMALYYGWRRTAAVLAVYLVAIMVSTIYFGWHFLLDDVAGIVLALAAVRLARWMVPRRPGSADDATTASGAAADDMVEAGGPR